jgi:hypothetical protein
MSVSALRGRSPPWRAAVAALIVSALARSAGRHPAEITTGDVKVATEPSQGA